MSALLNDSFGGIYGNAENKLLFSSLIEDGRLSHAYMIVGPEGSGKKTLAFSIAHALAKKTSKSDADVLCAKIKERCSADVFLIGVPDDKKTIGVEQVRAIIPSSVLSPNELEFKMYIFDSAEKMTTAAQNAMLKIIEEPPENVYIVLLCSDAASILPTVRSRVQTVKTELFDSETVKKYIKNHGIAAEPDRMKFAAAVCRGSIGRAVSLVDDDNEYAVFSSARTIIDKQLEKARGGTFFDFLNFIVGSASSRDGYERLLDYLSLAYRDISVKKVYENATMNFFTEEDAEKASMRLSRDSIASCTDTVKKMKNDCYFNVNINCAAVTLASLLWHAV